MTVTGTPDQAEVPFRAVFSEGFPAAIEATGGSLILSSYQAGKVVVIRARGGRVSTLYRTFRKPMGIAVGRRGLAVAERFRVWHFRDAPRLAPKIDPPGRHDACYVPRQGHVTGDIQVHDIAFAAGDLWLVNTRFSCLCTLDPAYSFVPRWKPPFVSEVAPGDRCHLNGVAVDETGPRYVTARGQTDAAQAWREGQATDGVVVDVRRNCVVAEGLSMPHSPRLYRGRLWVLASGQGQFGTVDPDTGRFDPVLRLPGYLRGLAFCGHRAFVGVCRSRDEKEFGRLPLRDHVEDLVCGVAVVDIDRGELEAMLEFEAGCEEIADLQVIPDRRFPALIGLRKETVQGLFVLPQPEDGCEELMRMPQP